MKIDISSINPEQFNVQDGEFNGFPAKLVTPQHVGCKWTWDNRIFRSSVWSPEGELYSAGFPKFTNLGENPEHFPPPKSLDGAQVISKIDGSLAILDWVNGRLSCRTRGTLTYESLDNRYDFEYCLAKYPAIEAYLEQHSNYTLLCEITTPNMRIVLDYGAESEFWLIGCIDKRDYRLAAQFELDILSKELGLKRPDSYVFGTIDAVLRDVDLRKNIEGFCIYSRGGQSIHKVKNADYLAKHRFKEHATLENTIDLYFLYGELNYNEFKDKLVEAFDYECFGMVAGFASRICDGAKEVAKILAAMEAKVNSLRNLSRKDAALTIIQAYGGEKNSRTSMAFSLLNGKPLTIDQKKKLLYQVIS